MNNLRGRYSNIKNIQIKSFFDPPTTSSQDIVSNRMNDTSSDMSYPNNKYKCTRNIGEGSASTIFEGVDSSNNKVLIKRIPKVECWRKELEVLKTLRNSSSGRILKYIDFYESNKSSFIITEYYPGFDLYEHIDINVPYSEDKSVKIFNEMIKCVKECHDNNIIHLDIKFENFMINSEKLFEKDKLFGKIILIDFGHAEMIKPNESIEKVRRGYSYGTSYFLCPEGYIENYYSSKSDIWSLAVCLSVLLTEDFPFRGSEKEYYRNSMNMNIQPGLKISDKMYKILCKCLNPNPIERPNIDELFSMINT